PGHARDPNDQRDHRHDRANERARRPHEVTPVPSVAELTAPYGNFMLAPRRGPGVCEVCFNLTDGYSRCYACTKNQPWLDAFVPISYSVGLEQLHHVLRSY